MDGDQDRVSKGMTDIDLSQFNHCYSTDPPRKRVLITSGEHAGKTGRLMGQWTYPFHLWTISLDVDCPPRWASMESGSFVIQE